MRVAFSLPNGEDVLGPYQVVHKPCATFADLLGALRCDYIDPAITEQVYPLMPLLTPDFTANLYLYPVSSYLGQDGAPGRILHEIARSKFFLAPFVSFLTLCERKNMRTRFTLVYLNPFVGHDQKTTYILRMIRATYGQGSLVRDIPDAIHMPKCYAVVTA